MSVPNVKLNNGVEIPQLGFGVFQVKPAETVQAVTTAFEVGYRHIDTAEMYGNEKEVGEAVRGYGLSPDEVFITSKLNNNNLGYDAALTAFDRTLSELGMDRIDLFLVHWPLPTVRDYVETWRALEQIHSEGRARAIGVSNFTVAHLQKLAAETDTVPAVNQVEQHPYLTQEALLSYHGAHGIATESWAPLVRGAVSDDEVIGEIAKAHDRTAAQVTLRWHIQSGNIVFPKSVTPSRIKENFDIFDFELSDDDMKRISGLDRNGRTGPDPDEFDYIPK